MGHGAESGPGDEVAPRAIVVPSPAGDGFLPPPQSYSERVKSWFGLDELTRDTRRELLALNYVGPPEVKFNQAVLTVEQVSLSCPSIQLEGLLSLSQARMRLDGERVSLAPGSNMVRLECRSGMHCVEINFQRQPRTYWTGASLVASSPASAQALVRLLRQCIGQGG